MLADWGEIRLRYVIATIAAGLLVACSGLPEAPPGTCSTPYQCEIEAYSRAR